MAENSISLEQATLHFLGKAQINASEADMFVAVRNHFAGIVQQQQANSGGADENPDGVLQDVSDAAE